jgi:peroxiredoxin
MIMPKKSKKLQIGEKAPEFSLPEAKSGEMVGLHELLGQPLIVIFGRGTW